MSTPSQLVIFRLDDLRYAIPLGAVERIVRAVEVTPLPKSSEIVLGIVDVAGRVLPVLNVRRRFGRPDKDISSADQFLIARTARREMILVVDESEGVIECLPADIAASAEILPGLKEFHGVIRLDGGLALICDLEQFVSLEEADALDTAVRQLTDYEP